MKLLFWNVMLLLGLCIGWGTVLTYSAPKATVLWHGMGDTCCFPFSMGAVKSQIETTLPGTYVYSVEIGGDIVIDEISGFLSNVDEQVDSVCQTLKAHPNLTNGFNAVGFSQGGQFLRAYVQRCNDPKVHNLITMGGQHQGVAELPECVWANSTICEAVDELLALGAYNPIVQNMVVQAQYFKDPLDYDSYLYYNNFLTDINNEITVNETYRQNLMKLNMLVLAKFEYDTTVVPRESEWFGEYEVGNVGVVLTMNETKLYKEDRIGLKALDEAGRVKKIGIPGNHMQFTLEWFTQNVILPFLA